MEWLKKFPWLALILLFVVYIVFGYYVGEKSPEWSRGIMELGDRWGLGLEKSTTLKFLAITETLFVTALTMLLAIPMALTKVFVGKSLKSDRYAIMTFLAWSLAAVFFMRWFEYFIQLLILLCTTLFCRLELQRTALKEWQIFLILLLICLGGFEVGMLTFIYHRSLPEAHA